MEDIVSLRIKYVSSNEISIVHQVGIQILLTLLETNLDMKDIVEEIEILVRVDERKQMNEPPWKLQRKLAEHPQCLSKQNSTTTQLKNRQEERKRDIDAKRDRERLEQE